MDSIFEKITLYDIIGYMIPGSIFVLLAGVQPFYYRWSIDKDLWNDSKGLSILYLVVVSYVVGVALSELAHIVLKEVRESERQLQNFLQKSEINPVDLINRSGVLASEVSKNLPLLECVRIMYGVIQADPNYKRIHNYASAEVMYKNMFMALSVGEVFWVMESFFYSGCQCCQNFFIVIVALVVFALSLLYYCRWKRFNQKKIHYTLLWFEKRVSDGELPSVGKNKKKR